MHDEKLNRPMAAGCSVKEWTEDEVREIARRIAEHPEVGSVELEFHPIVDPIDLDPLDPGIRETVRFLREHGFETCDSGDGATKFADPRWRVDGKLPEEVLDFPHVAMRVSPDHLVSEADRLAALLLTIGVELEPSAPIEGVPTLQATYDPAQPGLAFLFLTDVALVDRDQP